VLSVDALLFDLDGTLIDSKQDLALSIHHLQNDFHRPLSSESEIAALIGNGVVKLVERAIGALPAAELEQAVEAFKGYYRQHALDHTLAYPGIPDMLAHFKSKKMAVVTNKPTRISKYILEQLGLARYFPVILGGDSVTRKKPDPEGPLQAMEQLGVRTPQRVVMVGDSMQDVLAGRAAGVWTCGIISNIGDPELLKRAKPDFTVCSPQELTRIIN
jgi:phosphoglycolate phosphatase